MTKAPGAHENKGERKLNPKLLSLKPNVWVRLHQPKKALWHRQQHAGIAYDCRRGTLLLFGSDTHGLDWDNSVWEFNPVTEEWTAHYQYAGKETYGANGAGHAIAGKNRLLPWAMHTFDNIVYDPETDSLWVTAIPAHNPMRFEVPEAKIHPTWIYDLKIREWRIFENKGAPSPNFFAAASAYDPDRNVIVAYDKGGVWEIGPERKEWKKATDESYHEIHFVMEYDTKHKKFAVFGDYHKTNIVWVYSPGMKAGSMGTWEKKIPRGDECPKDQHFPVAFDTDSNIFLLVPDNMRAEKGENRRFLPLLESNTFVYDLETNNYHRLPQADMEPLGMNYMMVYDRYHKVFLLLTGTHKEPPTVWALKLDLKALNLRR
jgi:hypothetical protein